MLVKPYLGSTRVSLTSTALFLPSYSSFLWAGQVAGVPEWERGRMMGWLRSVGENWSLGTDG